MDNRIPHPKDSIIILIKIYKYLASRHQIYVIEVIATIANIMALSAAPLKLFYTILKNLYQKIQKHTTTLVNLTLLI